MNDIEARNYNSPKLDESTTFYINTMPTQGLTTLTNPHLLLYPCRIHGTFLILYHEVRLIPRNNDAGQIIVGDRKKFYGSGGWEVTVDNIGS